VKAPRLVPSMLICLAVAACGRPSAPGPESAAPPAPVRAEEVRTVPLREQVRAVGVLAPRDEVRLSFKLGGVVDRILVEAGDRVKAGDLLAVLKRAEVDAAVTQATEAAEKARRDLERARKLRADEVATEEQVEDLTTAYKVASANLRTAQFNARFARIEAPADGVVLQRLAEESELVQGGQPVLVLGATGQGWIVRASLADRDAVRVVVGDTAEVSFDAFPGRSFAGRVSRVASSADPQTGTFEVEIDVDQGRARFVRGLVAKVELSIAGRDGDDAVVAVPITALVEADGPEARMFVLDPEQGVARSKSVSIGPIIGERVVVRTGLVPGEQVITDGAAWLTDGRAVSVVGDRG
jgi:multidrug efflux system membrane fusion protein